MRAAENTLVSEQQFFDQEAATLTDQDLHISTHVIARYQNARPHPLNIPMDRLFSLALPLTGKRVLDYGCGHGENACLLAACGAEVTAFDLSPVSIAQARRRASLLGLADHIQLDVRSAGQTGYAAGSFDLVTCFAILHHLHTRLDIVYEEIDRVLKHRGQALFIEPVANSPVLRTLRRCLPIKTYATPDERQLLYRDFELLGRYFTKVEFEHFYCLERLKRVLGRFVERPLRWVDHYAQRLLPFFRKYYGCVLVIATR
jgi:2-polyprenyl-3-methyl-5-hydroxy-6-metoxy-1,4-benzoquinol methylase